MTSAWRRAHRRQGSAIGQIRRRQDAIGIRVRELSRSQSVLRRSVAFQTTAQQAATAADTAQQAIVAAEEAQQAAENVDLSNYPTKAEVPSIEETLFSAPLIWGSTQTGQLTSSASTAGILIAPFPLTILSATLNFTHAVAASTTNYWTLTLATAAGDVVSRTTQAAEIIARTAWTFNDQVWSTNRNLPINAALWVNATKTGTPADLKGAYLTLRYARTA